MGFQKTDKKPIAKSKDTAATTIETIDNIEIVFFIKRATFDLYWDDVTTKIILKLHNEVKIFCAPKHTATRPYL